MHLKEEVEALDEHPVESAGMEEVGEDLGDGIRHAPDRPGELEVERQVAPGDAEDTVEGVQARGGKHAHVNLVTQTC